MNQLTAHQLFFSRVEAAYSLEKRSGYQVVYATDGITETDMTEITKRIQCFQTSSRRHQYFHTSTDKTVIACSTVLPMTENYRSITDRSGRPGAFIAHCLVFSREDFAAIEDDPFAVLELEDSRDYTMPLFVLDADEMIKIQQNGVGAILLPVVPRFDPEKHSNLQEEGWSPDEFTKLLSLTTGASALLEEGRSIMMQSSYPQRVLDLLNLVLYLVPQDARWFCTFDTGVDGCLPAPGDFWAIGGERRISSSKLIHARVDQQKIEYTLEEAGGNQDPKAVYYGAWLSACLAHKGLSEVNRLSRAVQLLALAFEGKKPLPLREQLSKDALDSFLSVHEQRVRDRLSKTLIDVELDADIVQQYIDHKWNHIRATATTSGESYGLLKSAASGQIKPETLAKYLFNWLVGEGNKIDKWRKLLPFAEKCNLPPFEFLVASRVEPTILEKLLPSLGVHHKVRDKALQAMVNSPNEFLAVIENLFGVEGQQLPTPPEYFVNQASAILLGGMLAQNQQLIDRLNADEWGNLILQLAKFNAVHTLVPLTERIKRIKPQDAQAILATIKVQQKQKQPVPPIASRLLDVLEQAATLRHPPLDDQED